MLTTTSTLAALMIVAPAQAGSATRRSPSTPHSTPVAHAGRPKSALDAEHASAEDPVAGAIAAAQRSGQSVDVPSLTTESSTVHANPDGTLTADYSSAPRRVRQNGTWVPVDTTLVRRADGTYAPRAATAGVSIGGGHSTALVSMSNGAHHLALSWPSTLPEPDVSGATATYHEVLPGVDLQITADPSGYSSMLVVKNQAAAANPELTQLDFGMEADGLRLGETRNGGAEATDPGSKRVVFHTDTALMWDSSSSAAAATNRAARPDTAAGTNGTVGGHQAEIKVGVTGGHERLTLDKNLLTAPSTQFPVYVDPYWSGNPSQLKWARISSNTWDVYNSTSRSGASSARIGYDDWPGGAGEKARTYYQMNTSGIRGATIFDATLYVTERWAASCSNTAAVIYGVGTVSAWNSSGLNWGHEPEKVTGVLSTANGRELDCSSSSARVSPASLKFNILSHIATAAKNKASSATFVVEAKDMSDRNSWKQLGYGGGATLSVKYSYRPQFVNGTGNPQVRPSLTDQGRILTTTHTPTLSAQGINPKANGSQENVRLEYQVFNLAGAQVGTGYSGWGLNGGTWTTGSLPDGKYTWRAAVENASGLWGGVWSATQAFTVDTTAPRAPTVTSAQFPTGILGGSFTDNGVFAFGNDRTNNVIGYLFSMDSDLSNVVYGSNHGTPWAAGTVIRPGTIYFAKADNGNGTGAVVVNGTAGVTFFPGTTGAHTVYAKAVDQAGSTSPQTLYGFIAGTSTPSFAYGDKMVTGYTATNADGSTTVVPAATTTSSTGHLVTQASSTGNYFADGFQGMLANLSSTSNVAPGDTATFSFDLPKAAVWQIGANLTTATDYGTYSLVLDKGQVAEKTLSTGIDGYSTRVATHYVDFGTIKDDNGAPRLLPAGLHTLTLTVTGKNAASTGYQAGIDVIRLAPTAMCPINDTTACRNNTAISTYTGGSAPKVTPADADGTGNSFEATDLSSAGWTPGNTVTVNGAAIAMPSAYGNGSADNMLASGQIITVPTSVVNKGNAVVFVGFAGHGPVNGANGTITYATTSCGMTSQTYAIDSATDWAQTPASEAVLTFPHRNTKNATQTAVTASLFAISVPLLCPGAVVASITLPLVTTGVQSGVASLHLLGLGIRPTSVVGDTHWVGSWSAAPDTGAVQAQPDADTSVDATLNNQTVRIPVHLSIGTAGSAQKVRIHLSNAIGRAPVTFDAASVGLQDPAGSGAATTSAPVPLTFGGTTAVTLPIGADVTSDPVALSAGDLTNLLVSLKVHGSVTKVAGHQEGKTPIYITAADNADHTRDTSGTAYPVSTLVDLPYLAGVDVTTSSTNPAGAVVLFGDQTVNSDTAGGDGQSQLAAQMAAVLAEVSGEEHTPAGVLNAGTASWNNRTELPAAPVVPAQNATVLADREILAQTNVRTVVISSGSTDLLACGADTAAECAGPVTDKLVALATQARKYRTDDATNPAVDLPGQGGALKVYVATLPPFTAEHNAVQEAARELVNSYILGTGGEADLQGYADGIINFAAGVSTDGDDTADTVLNDFLFDDGAGNLYPSDIYYGAFAWEMLADTDPMDWGFDVPEGGTEPGAAPVAVWKFGEGTGNVAADSGSGTGSSDNPQTHNAALHDVTWSAGRLVGAQAGTFNGTSSYGSTDLKVNTAQSFTVSAWVRLTDKSADRTVFSRTSTGFESLNLMYQKATDRWVARMPSATSGDAVVWYDALSSMPAQAGIWTHLAVVYDADTGGLTLYVDGAADTLIDAAAPFNDTAGATYIGRGASTWFAGDIADVQVWNRAVDPAEMAEIADPELVADWEFEDDSIATVAKDSSFYGHDGVIEGGASWIYPGHDDWDIGAVDYNGTDAVTTSGPLLRTDQSFSVAAWVRLTRTDGTFTVLGQEGSHTGRFQVRWSSGCSCWQFVSATTDADAPATVVAAAPAPATSPLNKWTHLAAVFDAKTGTMSLYVDGAPAGSAVTTTPGWNAGGAFTVGRTLSAGLPAGWLAGDVDAVHAFQGAISPEMVSELSLP